MVYSAFPVFVDGVSLDSFAWNVEAKVRTWPAAREADVVLPGVDGKVGSLNDDIDSTTFTLSMWLIGTDETGVIPVGSNAVAQCRANLDALAFLFGKRHALLSVSEVVDAVGTQRQFYGKVTDAIGPELTAGSRGKFTVSITVLDGMWQDVNTSDWTQSSVVSGNAYEVTTLQGATGPISDAVLTVTGPATNPQLTDPFSNAYVRLNAALTSSQVWRINCRTWATRYGAGLGFGSNDTTGTDAQAVTVFGGGTNRFLRLQPNLSTGLRRVLLSVSGSGFTSATAIGVRARRKFLQ